MICSFGLLMFLFNSFLFSSYFSSKSHGCCNVWSCKSRSLFQQRGRRAAFNRDLCLQHYFWCILDFCHCFFQVLTDFSVGQKTAEATSERRFGGRVEKDKESVFFVLFFCISTLSACLFCVSVMRFLLLFIRLITEATFGLCRYFIGTTKTKTLLFLRETKHEAFTVWNAPDQLINFVFFSKNRTFNIHGVLIHPLVRNCCSCSHRSPVCCRDAHSPFYDSIRFLSPSFYFL